MKDAVPEWLTPGLDRFKGEIRVERLIVFGADNFVQIVGRTVEGGEGVLVYACYVGVAPLREVVCGARAEGSASSNVSMIYL